jgi:hypothetical protein
MEFTRACPTPACAPNGDRKGMAGSASTLRMVPVEFINDGAVLNYFSMITALETPLTVAAPELRIECEFTIATENRMRESKPCKGAKTADCRLSAMGHGQQCQSCGMRVRDGGRDRWCVRTGAERDRRIWRRDGFAGDAWRNRETGVLRQVSVGHDPSKD